MSSGFSGGGPEFFAAGGRATSLNGGYNTNLNPQQQFSLRSSIAGILPDPAAQIRRPELIGKRSLADFQQNQQGLGVYLRNVKSRVNFQHATPISPFSTVEFSPVPSILPEASSVSNSMISRYGLPILQQHRLQPPIHSNRNVNNVCGNSGTTLPGLGSEVLRQDSEKKMMNHRLQELEKELLGEEEDGEAVSVVTNSDFSPIPCSKQSLIDAAVAISEGKLEVAAEILTRLQQVANPRGTSEQRVTAYMVSALKSRVDTTEQHRLPVGDLYSKEHTLSVQMLYDVSPCFKLGFMAANLAILEATWDQGFNKVHVVDFDIGRGGQYMHLLHTLVAKKPADKRAAASLKITTFTDSVPGDEHRLKLVGEGLKALASKIGVCLTFSVKNSNTTDLSRENLGVEQDEALAVNFAFKLYKLADESVTTENPRDELLRRVKGLSPTVTTVVEQDMNANTAPLTARVRETCEYYGALFESLEATVSREHPDRVRVEEALGRKMGNSVACEGRDRVERCEVLGKWRARMSMAGFQPVPMGQPVAESLRVKLNSGTRGNPGFTVKDQSGGICFGWMGRTLTVASAWR
ncbi:UNVERIFIED_CONTAM: Scarecrow-like protein 8 [Sesamum angustifolium]|uniref:Scarecrow-like protein 8 n=1 Tax=Sesamum angustifolium TaxID=2727405 RepID=A0AAW2PUH4_9LAMI